MNRLIVACIATLAFSAFGSAQVGAGQTVDFGAPTPPPTLLLLTRPDVQQDLQFSNGQKQGLESIRQKSARQAKGHAGGMENVQFVRAVMRERAIQENREAEALLSDAQRKRLDEIKIQLQGNAVILEPAMQKELEITEQQRSQIAALRQQQQAEIRSRMGGPGFGQGMAHMFEKSQQRFNAGLAKILTTDQAAKLDALRGRPFHGQDPGRGYTESDLSHRSDWSNT